MQIASTIMEVLHVNARMVILEMELVVKVIICQLIKIYEFKRKILHSVCTLWQTPCLTGLCTVHLTIVLHRDGRGLTLPKAAKFILKYTKKHLLLDFC